MRSICKYLGLMLLLLLPQAYAAGTGNTGDGCDPRVEAAASNGMKQMTLRGQEIFSDYMEPSYQSPESVLDECLSGLGGLSLGYDLGFGDLDLAGLLDSLLKNACKAGVSMIQGKIDDFGSSVAGTINPAANALGDTGTFGVRLDSSQATVDGNIDIQSSIERWGNSSINSWGR